MANPGNDRKLDHYHQSSQGHSNSKVVDQKRQSMAHTTNRCHGSGNQSSYPGMTTPSQAAIVREGFRKPHADAGAHRCRHSYKEGIPAVMGRQSSGEYWS